MDPMAFRLIPPALKKPAALVADKDDHFFLAHQIHFKYLRFKAGKIAFS